MIPIFQRVMSNTVEVIGSCGRTTSHVKNPKYFEKKTFVLYALFII